VRPPWRATGMHYNARHVCREGIIAKTDHAIPARGRPVLLIMVDMFRARVV
jgi:hypothetical protein